MERPAEVHQDDSPSLSIAVLMSILLVKICTQLKLSLHAHTKDHLKPDFLCFNYVVIVIDSIANYCKIIYTVEAIHFKTYLFFIT